MRTRFSFAGLVVLALIIAGCAGGGQRVTPTQAIPQKVAQGSFVILVPQKTSAQAKPQYISASTKSVSFAVSTDGQTFGPAQVVPIDTSTCPLNGGYYQCSAYFTVAPGPAEIQISTYATTDGTGVPLSQASITETIVQDQLNVVSVVLNAVVASLNLAVSPISLAVGTPTTVIVTWQPVDAAGNLIIGPGALVTASGASLLPTLALSPGDGFGTPVYNAASHAWSFTYDGSSEENQQLTVTNTSLATATATLYVGATPSPSPTASPTASPSATPTGSPTLAPTASPSATPTSSAGPQGIVNGDFETGDLTGWYQCYAGKDTRDGEIDANPAPVGSPVSQPSTGPTAKPSPDVSVQSVDPHSGSYAARVGTTGAGQTHYYGKGLSGLCQNVTLPTVTPPQTLQLTLWVNEYGNTTSFATNDIEADILGSIAGLSASNSTTSAVPDLTLFAETNCYDDLAVVHDAACEPTASPLPPGNAWREKGPYDLTAYSGQTVTLMLGQWGSSTATVFYSYGLFDDVSLSTSP